MLKKNQPASATEVDLVATARISEGRNMTRRQLQSRKTRTQMNLQGKLQNSFLKTGNELRQTFHPGPLDRTRDIFCFLMSQLTSLTGDESRYTPRSVLFSRYTLTLNQMFTKQESSIMVRYETQYTSCRQTTQRRGTELQELKENKFDFSESSLKNLLKEGFRF